MTRQRGRVVVDSIHGDIHLNDIECKLIDTASFQRLRRIKQLSMGHLTYPNATHTRFAHSLGVLRIMTKVIDVARDSLKLEDRDCENLRLSALLHDIGHYPYSHLMEGVDKVVLAEDMTGNEKKTIDASFKSFPDHETVGKLIVTKQRDISEILGLEKAAEISALFTRERAANPQLSKLIHSSLDMDRLDYLLRDSNAAGVPYGHIDLNYLLNNLKASPSGLIGVKEKALPAAEQFLMAHYFMYRAVYHHKTTVAFEEACRQLLRRIRDAGKYGFPQNGDEIEGLVTSDGLNRFDDSFVDNIISQAIKDEDSTIRALASTISNRIPPRLLKQVHVLRSHDDDHHAGKSFMRECKYKLADLAQKNGAELGRFMYHETKPVKFEDRPAKVIVSEASLVEPESIDQLVKVFVPGNDEPVSIVEVKHSLLRFCADYTFQTCRLYYVDALDRNDLVVEKLIKEVANWS